MTDFLTPTEGSWAKLMVDEVIRPAQEASEHQPFLQEMQAGSASRKKLAQMGAEMIWITNSFGNWMAAIAARCPERDHFTKVLILKNALEESEHPPMLVKYLRALGYDGERLLTDPRHSHKPTPHSQALVDFLTATAFHRSFPEAVAAVGSMEAVNPGQSAIVYRSMIDNYGLTHDDVEWAAIHLGEIEQKHAQAALVIVERYIGEDASLRAQCEYAIRRGVYLAGTLMSAIYDAPLDLSSVSEINAATPEGEFSEQSA
jgi:pyrroloquinoline quinone (PQQ) biosynthesis protein C